MNGRGSRSLVPPGDEAAVLTVRKTGRLGRRWIYRTMPSVTTLYHVTSAANRDSIANHGLDWRHGGGGIAGSLAPEQAGVFLCRDREEADFFMRMGKRRFAALDIWEVMLEDHRSGELLDCEQLGREFDGFFCWMEAILPSRLRLVERDL